MLSHENAPAKLGDPFHCSSETPSTPQAAASPGVIESLYSPSQCSKSGDSTSISSMEDMSSRQLTPGVYVPIPSLFDKKSDEAVDEKANAELAVQLVKDGIAGIVVHGSTGEAVHLTHQERKRITKITRAALDNAGYDSLPIIVGCGAQSTRGTVELCQEAWASGGDYALVLPPSYYQATYRRHSLAKFFQEVADASPIPILIYNYPAAASGIDMDSDLITELAKHPKIVGCKLTCGNTGKLGRIAAAVNATTPFEPGSGFFCFGGSADFILPTMVVGGSGAICGLANIAPKACVRIFTLYAASQIKEAQKLQAIVARGDWAAISNGVVGLKSALETYYGYQGFGRKPLPRPSAEEAQQYAKEFEEVVQLERSLSTLRHGRSSQVFRSL